MDHKKRIESAEGIVEKLKRVLGNEYRCFPIPDLPVDDIGVEVVVDYKKAAMIAVGVYTERGRYEQDLCYLTNVLRRTHITVGFLFDEELRFQIVDVNCLSDNSAFNSQFEEIVSRIRKEQLKIETDPNPQKVKQRILQIFDDTPEFDTKKNCRALLESVCDKLEFSLGQIHLSENDENKFMLTLLGKIDCEYLWRYTSLTSLFETIKNEKHAMCCPVSMNDASEGTYADSKMQWFPYYLKNETYYHRKNDVFMLSCCNCEEEDNLSMWRLYGDDSKGICIKYDMPKNIDNIQMYFAKVNYASDIDFHPELDFLNSLQNTVIEGNWYFVIDKWYIWRYFFKSSEYAIENEVRLIFDNYKNDDITYHPDTEWYQDKNNQIISRRALFTLEEFPLKIREIVFGANVTNIETNIEQVKFMAMVKHFSNLDIENDIKRSRIKSYRK